MWPNCVHLNNVFTAEMCLGATTTEYVQFRLNPFTAQMKGHTGQVHRWKISRPSSYQKFNYKCH